MSTVLHWLIRLLLVVMVLVGSSQVMVEPISVPDDAGNAIRLSGPVHRVRSLAPALTEIIYHVGGGNRPVLYLIPL